MITQDFQNKQKGPCIIVGHGESIDTFDWHKHSNIPKLFINFVLENMESVYGVTVWDKDVHQKVAKKIENWKVSLIDRKPFIFSYAEDADYPYDVFIDEFFFRKTDGKKLFSGTRAIMLAQYIGFDPIYLIGFDYNPHLELATDIYPRYKEANKLINEFEHDPIVRNEIEQSMQTQMKNFQDGYYTHRRIYNLNPDSKLKFFECKQIGE